MRHAALATFLVTISLGLGGVAHATLAALPAATVSSGVGDAYDGFTQVTNGFGSISLAGGLALASAADAPGAAVEAVAPGNQALAGSSLSYAVEIDGPAGIIVPVVLSYRLFVENLATGFYHNGSAEVSISGNGTYADDHLYSANYTTNIYESCTNGCVTPGRMSADFNTGNVYTISLSALAAGAEAYADPKLTIDTAWARANPAEARQLSISLSSGVGNALGAFTLGVPEPSAWALMLVGVGAMGATLRRRRTLARA